jgi:hypothetical protein
MLSLKKSRHAELRVSPVNAMAINKVPHNALQNPLRFQWKTRYAYNAADHQVPIHRPNYPDEPNHGPSQSIERLFPGFVVSQHTDRS